ncbi:MAG: MBOAT family protein [Candidatus Symbiothrix sp.]|jgi:D-alanyl-lipoteichoic acid acyltransferase DltB (MBOAT superfamily)|nr:MBOAT family protein [Candidatus Symbiothrix sp.]
MLFNSIDFAIFLPIVFSLYWFVTNKDLKLQNLLVLLASYFFYAFWDWRFLFLIVFTTIVDYSMALVLSKQENEAKRKLFLWIGIIINLCILGFFKYYNFFIESFVDIFSFFGRSVHSRTLNIILPVGISFYIFQTMSYLIDVYKRKIGATKDFVSFAAFVSFFPQVMAGPIERATNFLPQFFVKRDFDYSKAVDGLRQMLWGFFKKIVVADNCSQVVDKIFNDYQMYPGSLLLIGAFFFSIQIYADFSGYSDIAIGCSRLFGFNLTRNFAFPYFSRDMAEFWRRWHISLTTWLKDYVYIPLGGSRCVKWKVIRNTFVIFLLSGLWHGANWTYIIWGALNAIYFLPLLIVGKNRKNLNVVAEDRFFPSVKEFFQMLFTFLLCMFAWIFFRAQSITDAIEYLKIIFSSSLFIVPETDYMRLILNISIIATIILFVMEWIQRRNQHGLQIVPKQKVFRIILYLFLLFMMLTFGGNQQSFIYFQF